MQDFKNDDVNHLTTASFDWKFDTLAVHWTYPDPEEFEDEQTLEDSISMFAAIGKHVLRKAERLLKTEL